MGRSKRAELVVWGSVGLLLTASTAVFALLLLTVATVAVGYPISPQFMLAVVLAGFIIGTIGAHSAERLSRKMNDSNLGKKIEGLVWNMCALLFVTALAPLLLFLLSIAAMIITHGVRPP